MPKLAAPGPSLSSCNEASGREFRQGVGREVAESRSVPPDDTRIYRLLPPVPSLPNVSQAKAVDPELRAAAARLQEFRRSEIEGITMPRSNTYVSWPRSETAPLRSKYLQYPTYKSGRPDLNRGPHRPELWAESDGVHRSTCKSMSSSAATAAVNPADIPVDSPGFGREIDSLAKPSWGH